MVEEIQDLATLARPIIDYNDNKLVNGPNVVDVAKCIVKDAKPKATVKWEFESPRKLKHIQNNNYDLYQS